MLDGSRAYSVVYVYANLLGNEAGRAIYDGDAMIASCGQMLATGKRFSFHESYVTSALVDLDAVRVNRARTASYQPQMQNSPRLVPAEFDFPAHQAEKPQRQEISLGRIGDDQRGRICPRHFARTVRLSCERADRKDSSCRLAAEPTRRPWQHSAI